MSVRRLHLLAPPTSPLDHSETKSLPLQLFSCLGIGNKPNTPEQPKANVAMSKAMLPTTCVIQVGSKAFAAQTDCDYDITLTDSPSLDVLTCFALHNSRSMRDDLQKAYTSYLQKDDVFCDAFLKNVVLISDQASITDSVAELLKSWGCVTVAIVPTSCGIPSGPYFFSSRGIFSAWRLFPDENNAFVISTIPSQIDRYTYQNLNAAAFGMCSLCIGVPSRLVFSSSQELPLAGMRIAIKDLFHLKGVVTGCGNRAYRNLHGPSSISSSAVESILNSGAIIVGKTKTVEFGGSQEVIGDWSDYFYAFNPRGDGYLASTGSSTGSASALATYPWLDITLGTDAGGSIRDPAVAQGIYGFRPSHDGAETPDVVIPCGIFHTPGFLGRCSDTMLTFGREWLKGSSDAKPLRPTRVLFPTEYNSNHEGVQAVAEEWVNSFAQWLGATILKISVEEKWKATKPVNADKGFFETFDRTFIDLTYSGFWTYLTDFRDEYKTKFSSAPYVCKVTQYLWDRGKAMSDNRKQAALDEVAMHNKWFLTHVLDDLETLIIIPRYKLDYRDEYLPPPEKRGYEGFDSNLHASLAGVPNLIVPVGQCPFYSKISEREEMFPVSLSIIAPKGKDIGLLNLIHDYLTDKRLPTSVLTGRTAFPLTIKKSRLE